MRSDHSSHQANFREAALKKTEKPEIRISVTTRLNTTEWEFGRKFLQTLCDADARLSPEYVGNSEPIKIFVGNIDDCKASWAPEAIIDGPVGPSHVKWNFLWKRAKAIKYWGCVHHTLTTRSGELKLGWITLTATPDKRVDWSDLFHRLCILTNPKFATMHLRTDAEARPEAFSENVVENFGVNDLLYGHPDVALKERGLAYLSWANFFGEQYASEVDVAKLQENGFSVESIGEGFLVTLTPTLSDVMDNFSLFSERRVALRKLFRPGLFRINEEPKPLPE
ncbi:hypothetical protein [Variovorax sp. GB1R11]|uniref:hypothetical protein n=1 Tax=Variovorax sp. GB1R11 TaxID=3443741 RepID=UPI003F49527C